MTTVSDADKRQLAVDVALAALVGDGVFNFGEIIEHPIMSSLAGTPEAWLADLLRVFHTGDVDAFSMIVAGNRAAYESQVMTELCVARGWAIVEGRYVPSPSDHVPERHLGW